MNCKRNERKIERNPNIYLKPKISSRMISFILECMQVIDDHHDDIVTATIRIGNEFLRF